MTLPLDTHLENSQSHYYEDRFPIFLLTVYIDPIFIAIVPRFQKTLATLAGKCHADCLSFFGRMEHCKYYSSNNSSSQYCTVCYPEGNMLVLLLPLKGLLLVNFFYPILRVSRPKQNPRQSKADPILPPAGSEIATKAEALVDGATGSGDRGSNI